MRSEKYSRTYRRYPGSGANVSNTFNVIVLFIILGAVVFFLKVCTIFHGSKRLNDDGDDEDENNDIWLWEKPFRSRYW